MSIEQSPTLGALGAAIARAQAELKTASKDSVNPHFKSKYADLTAIWEVVRTPFAKQEIAIVQMPMTDETEVLVSTMLIHSSGEWLRFTVRAMPRDLSPQSVGSVISYLRRYGLSAACGVVADDDDDGNASQFRSQQSQPEQKQKPIAQAQKPTEKPLPAPVVLSEQHAALKADLKKLGAQHAGAEKALVMKLLHLNIGKLVEELTPAEFTELENKVIEAMERAQ